MIFDQQTRERLWLHCELTLSAWSAAKNCSQTRKTKQPMCTKFEHVVLPGLQNSNPIHYDDSLQGSVYKSRRRRCHPQMVPWPSNVLNPWSCILRCWRCGWWFRTWNLGQAKHPHCSLQNHHAVLHWLTTWMEILHGLPFHSGSQWIQGVQTQLRNWMPTPLQVPRMSSRPWCWPHQLKGLLRRCQCSERSPGPQFAHVEMEVS